MYLLSLSYIMKKKIMLQMQMCDVIFTEVWRL